MIDEDDEWDDMQEYHESGVIGDKEVQFHRTGNSEWFVDIVRHTSDNTTELVDGWVVHSYNEALTLFVEKVDELKQEEE
tara:strand:- start:44 stop:280 length:237 start_codon:yes stop_codon:yes gene_type:complete